MNIPAHFKFLLDSVEPVVYAQLMTSNRKRSKLMVDGVTDKNLPQPSAEDF